jgi:hypothetical protein
VKRFVICDMQENGRFVIAIYADRFELALVGAAEAVNFIADGQIVAAFDDYRRYRVLDNCGEFPVESLKAA